MARAKWMFVCAWLTALPGCNLFGLGDCPVADCAPVFLEQVVLPADGATNVPLNAHVWIAGQSDGSQSGAITVTVVGGFAVQGTERELVPSFSSSGVRQFVPSKPLAPNTSYVVRTGGMDVTRFTTGTSTLEKPTAAPQTTVTDRHVPQSHCDGASGTVALNPPGALNLVVIAGQEPAFDGDRAEGTVMLMSMSPSITLSSGLCGVWNGKDKVRFGTLDVAGGFSGWSEIL